MLEGLQLYYRAFMDLTSCRAALYGAEGPIKWTAIVMWADVNGLDGEQLEDLMYHIGKMDVVYLEHKAKKIKAR